MNEWLFCHRHLIYISTEHYTFGLDVSCENYWMMILPQTSLIHISSEHFTYELDACGKTLCFLP
jgi:hypothetical protein